MRTGNSVEISTRVRDEFDSKARHYESNRLSEWYKEHARNVSEQSPKLENGDILDVGCATGYLLRLLCEKNPDARAVGIDISAKMLNQAQTNAQNLPQAVCYINDNWEKLAPPNSELLGQFDFKLIVCANTFHYFLNPLEAIRKMHRLLAKDGTLLLLEREKTASILTSFWGLLHRHLIKDQVEFYQTEDIIKLFKKAGFHDAKVISSVRKYFWKGKLYTSIALIEAVKT